MGNSTGQTQGFEKEVYKFTVDEILSILDTNRDSGLSAVEAQQRQSKYGENRLKGDGGVKWYSLLMKQISNAMILVLVLAMALSYGVTDYIEGGVITAVIVLNVVIGFYQEFQAEKKMDSLRSLASPSARVIRDGQDVTVPSGQVVPGDIVEIKMGDTVPADLRLFEVMNLAVDDAILTGESKPNSKNTDDYTPKLDQNGQEIPLVAADCKNMGHSSTTVTKGRARGVVVYTGMYTEIGRIAASMTSKKRKANRSMSRRKYGPLQPVKGGALRVWDGIGQFLGLTVGTPLQIKLSKLAYFLFGCALLLAIIVFGVNKFDVTNEVAIYAISTGIAIIPESLIAVLTITMVVGMTQMRKRRVVVRQLNALEALGGITNICSDKTGTLTKGKMVAHKAWIPGVGIYTIDRSGHPFQTSGTKITLGPAPKSRVEAEAERERQRAERDRQRSTIGLQFDVPVDKYEKDRQKQIFNEKSRPPSPSSDGEPVPEIVPELEAFLESAALCNLATIKKDNNEWKTTGDPTEVALQVLAHRFDSGKPKLLSEGWKQLAEHPFDSKVKMMSVIYKREDADSDSSYIQFTKGASERVIEVCDFVGTGKHRKPMTSEKKRDLLDMMDFLAEQGLRVLAIAHKASNEEAVRASSVELPEEAKDWDEAQKDAWETEKERVRPEQIECHLTLLGLAGLYDPPRDETTDAVRDCTRAGIKVHMLTGDHPSTATAIAKDVGIIPRNMATLGSEYAESMVKTAAEFERMTDTEIDDMPTLPFVIARCAPATKTRMIDALHRRSLYCAMTGDGVNDGPSLQRANVGIAMGMAGSDVAKSASDILLTDDNFASIVNAIEEGRRMFDNIQKFILHLLTSNVGEVILLVVGLAFQDEAGFSVFPLSPLQILWINMLTSSFPAFGLGREKAASDILRRPPHDTKKGVFTWQIIVDMLVYGTIMGVLCLLTFIIVIYGPGPDTLGYDCNRSYSDACHTVFRARAAVFAELTWLILISAWEFKSLRNSLFNLDPTRSDQLPDPEHKPDDEASSDSQSHHSRRRRHLRASRHRARSLPQPFTFLTDLWENKFLFFAVVIGAVSVFPAVYIPGLNTSVFKHVGISWEWGLSVGSVVLFVAGVEAWKATKRVTGWFEDHDMHRDRTSRQGMWSMARTWSKVSSLPMVRSFTRSRGDVTGATAAAATASGQGEKSHHEERIQEEDEGQDGNENENEQEGRGAVVHTGDEKGNRE